MACEILTNTESLHTVSTPVIITDGQISDDAQKIIRALVASIPEDAAGLSAPQINYFKRAFIANFPDMGMYAFINPTVTGGGTLIPSTEGCLSLPGCTRTLLRLSQATVEADAIFKINIEHRDKAEAIPYFDDLATVVSEFGKMNGVNASIVQHEFDHLEGVLITDHKEFVSRSEDTTKRFQDRYQRIHKKRHERKVKQETAAKQKVTKPNPKKTAKLKKQQKSADKRRRKQIAVEELYKAIASGTISLD